MLHFCLTYCDYRNIIAQNQTSNRTATPATGNVMSESDVRKENDAWISLGEASRLLGMSRQTVLTWAVKGELDARHVAGRTVISRESVERVAKQGDVV